MNHNYISALGGMFWKKTNIFGDDSVFGVYSIFRIFRQNKLFCQLHQPTKRTSINFETLAVSGNEAKNPYACYNRQILITKPRKIKIWSTKAQKDIRSSFRGLPVSTPKILSTVSKNHRPTLYSSPSPRFQLPGVSDSPRKLFEILFGILVRIDKN